MTPTPEWFFVPSLLDAIKLLPDFKKSLKVLRDRTHIFRGQFGVALEHAVDGASGMHPGRQRVANAHRR